MSLDSVVMLIENRSCRLTSFNDMDSCKEQGKRDHGQERASNGRKVACKDWVVTIIDVLVTDTVTNGTNWVNDL